MHIETIVLDVSGDKFCKDCDHTDSNREECSLILEKRLDRYRRQRLNMVSGQFETYFCRDTNTIWRGTRCKSQRSYNWITARLFGKCGQEGRFFKKKPIENSQAS